MAGRYVVQQVMMLPFLVTHSIQLKITGLSFGNAHKIMPLLKGLQGVTKVSQKSFSEEGVVYEVLYEGDFALLALAVEESLKEFNIKIKKIQEDMIEAWVEKVDPHF